MINFISLPYNQKLSLVHNLQNMREDVRKESRARKVAKERKPRKHKPVFFSDAIEKLFYSMSEEAQKFVVEGG